MGDQVLSQDRLKSDWQVHSNLAPNQRQVYLGQLLNPQAPLYNMAMLFRIDGKIDKELFDQSLNRVIAQSEAMRTTIQIREGVPTSIVNSDYAFESDYVDLRNHPDVEVQDWILDRSARLFDLEKGAFDSVILQLDENTTGWLFIQHHVVSDMASFEIIFRGVSDCYRTFQREGGPADFEAEQGADAGKTVFISDAVDDPGRIQAGRNQQLEFYGSRHLEKTTRSSRAKANITPEQQRAIDSRAADDRFFFLNRELTLFCLYASAFGVYLHKVCNKDQFNIGMPIHNRKAGAGKNTPGLFVDVFPLCIEVADGDSFANMFAKVRSEVMSALKSSGQAAVRAEQARDLEVVVNYMTTEFGDFADFPCLAEWLDIGHVDPQHTLRLQILALNREEPVSLFFDVNEAVLNADRADAAIRHFVEVMMQSLERPNTPCSEIGLLPKSDGIQLANQVVVQPFNGSVIEKFEQQCTQHPDRVALVQGETQVTYQQLNRYADALARKLLDYQVPLTRIGIACERSIELLVSVLAAMKAGAAYIPLQPDLPSSRLQKIEQIGKPDLVLFNAPHCKDWIRDSVPLLRVELDELDIDCLKPGSVPEQGDTAYIMFTSGSTGEPKGVEVSHRNLSLYIDWAIRQYVPASEMSKAEADREYPSCVMPLFTPFGFDLTVTTLFMPLCSGGSVHIYPENETGDAFQVRELITNPALTIAKLTPAHLGLIDGMDLAESSIHSLIVGGENLTRRIAESVSCAFNNKVRIFNEYGPTEAVVGCMSHIYNPEDDKDHSVSIGSPADNLCIYLLDEGLNPVPAGIAGEIFIAGDRLASGYFEKPDLTDEVFIDDPFVAGQRMYRSGDFARINEAGMMIYLGRRDNQVKINGVRVETAEIEKAINEYPGVQECLVKTVPISGGSDGVVEYCAKCGIASNYPGITFDEERVCHFCNEYEGYKDKAQKYFGQLSDFRDRIVDLSKPGAGEYDCLVLLSGGKDSTYMLYQVVNMGFRVMTMTLDNGYISSGAIENIRKTTAHLGVTHEFVSTEYMGDIFADSLKRHCSVCYGCFKTIYTLAYRLADQHGIPAIVTGLSRGQFFETRLVKQIFEEPDFDPDRLDSDVLELRKVYHRVPDKVTEALETDRFLNDQVFERIAFVDFYRYCDVSMDELYSFLDNNAPWIRPKDTGRSSNCLINDTGIYVHKKKQGYHNYALPYSWDVRLGHKTREQAISELNDEISTAKVREHLDQVGFDDAELWGTESPMKLAVYFRAGATIEPSRLKSFLEERLAREMVPTLYCQVDRFQITTNGKIDVAALPEISSQNVAVPSERVAAENDTERALLGIWHSILGNKEIGTTDNFFDMGGDSISAIQIISLADKVGIRFTPNMLFQYQTVRSLCAQLNRDLSHSPERESGSVNPDRPLVDLSEEHLSVISKALQ